MTVVYLVGDGDTDLYGIFSTRKRAQAWIDRQRQQRYPWADVLTINEMPVDEATDLRSDP